MCKSVIYLLFFSCMMCLHSLAQQFAPASGNEGYYQIRTSLQIPDSKELATAIWHFKVTKVIDSSLYVDCRLISYKGEINYKGGKNTQGFSTDDLLACRLNNTRDLEMLCLLNKKFSYILKKGDIVNQPDIVKIFEANIAAWQLQDNIAGIMKNNAWYYLTAEMALLFPSLPTGLKTLPDSWTSPDTMTRYNVAERTARSVSYKAVRSTTTDAAKSSAATYKAQTELSLATGMVLNAGFTNTMTGPYGVSGKKTDQVQELTITQLPSAGIKISPLSEDIKAAIVTANRYSKALFNDPSYDSAKVASYFRHYDPLFGNVGWYQLIRLDLLSGTHFRANMRQYDSLLVKTPDSVLAPYSMHLFNKAQHVRNINADSLYHTVYYLSKYKNDFRSWVQESYAQSFMQMPIEEMLAEARKQGISEEKIASMLKELTDSRAIAKKLMEKLLQDGDTAIRQEIYPLSLWVRTIQDSPNKDSLLWIAGELGRLGHHKEYSNVHRYGLLVYKQLLAADNTKEAAGLLDNQIAGMEERVKDSTDKDRYPEQNMLAYAYKLKSDAVKPTDPRAAMTYLSMAAKYSPGSLREKAHTSFYDRAFLGSEESYRPAFAEALIKEGNSKEGLLMLTEQLNVDPAILGELQKSFAQNFPQLDFYHFFNDVVMKTWKTAPDFSLRSPDGKISYKLADYRGKWLLIDFWGTWCGPCREEMPKINEFVKKIRDRKDLAFLSIACRDSPEPVTRYLSAANYHIPVCMADNMVESSYAVPYYPSKFLISPAGAIFPIAFGQDWEKAVEEFASLQPKKIESHLQKQKNN